MSTEIKKYVMFKKELDYVAMMMRRNDPDGDYDAVELACEPMCYIGVLEQWKEDCGYEYPIPGWIDKCIEYLMLLIV